MVTDLETALRTEPTTGLYWLDSNISIDNLRDITRELGYIFYYINGAIVTDHPSFFVALTHTFEWPQWAKSNWDAIFDVITEPRYYEPYNKSVILFDQCHNLAQIDPASFNIVVSMFRDMFPRFEHYLKHSSMQNREPYQVYILLRGEATALNAISENEMPIPKFTEG